jgi:outer membrane protein TolC
MKGFFSNMFLLHAGSAIFFAVMVPSAIMAQKFTLKQAITEGIEKNYSIRLQKVSEQMANTNNTLGNAGFLPTVDLNATQNNTFNTTHQEQFSGTVRDVTNARNSTLNIGVQLNWTLFDGFNMFVQKKMLETLVDLGENGTRAVMEGTVSDIAMTYYGIIQLEKLVRVSRDAADLSLQRKKIAEAKLSLGSGSRLMLMQSSVDLNADSTRLIQQLTQLENARTDMNRLLCRDTQAAFFTEDTIVINEPGSYDSLINLALQQNTLLTSSRLNMDLARQGIGEARSGLYPQLDVSAGYSYGTLSAETGFLKYNRAYGPSIGVSLHYTLFNGFNVHRAIRLAKLSFESGEINVADADAALRSDMWKILNQFKSSLAIIRMQTENIRVARENVDVAFEKYKLGSISDIELREIQRNLIDAEYQLILSQFEAKKSEVELLRLCGSLLARVTK